MAVNYILTLVNKPNNVHKLKVKTSSMCNKKYIDIYILGIIKGLLDTGYFIIMKVFW